MKYIKRFNEHVATEIEPPVVYPPITGGDEGGDDENLHYYDEWLQYHTNNEHPHYFGEIWSDEAYHKKLKNRKDAASYNFYHKLWFEHMDDHGVFAKQINQMLIDYIQEYNQQRGDDYRKQNAEDEIQTILTSHEIEMAGNTIYYRVQKPTPEEVAKFTQHHESEEEAAMPLLMIDRIEFPETPEPDYDEEPDAYSKWIKTVYNPFINQYLKPWAEKNNWKLWKY
jgi:hypothetical protein